MYKKHFWKGNSHVDTLSKTHQCFAKISVISPETYRILAIRACINDYYWVELLHSLIYCSSVAGSGSTITQKFANLNMQFYAFLRRAITYQFNQLTSSKMAIMVQVRFLNGHWCKRHCKSKFLAHTLSTQHVRLSCFRLCRPDSLELAAWWT